MIGFIVFGLFVGVLARLLLPGRQRIGLLWTLILGLVGSVVGGTIASYLGTGQIFELNLIGAIAAIVSSLVLLAVGESMGLGAGRDRRRLGR
ncbi:MAG: GlsB/YeaQ/YmgE family stress response membrane protein [Thermoleophilaceae bacterium]